jgi:hypothetical protein
MFRRLFLLNVFLLALGVAGAIRLRHDERAFSASHRVDRIQPESGKPLPKPLAAAAAAVRQEWPDIAAHNPFSFDRNDVALAVTPPAPEQPKRPKPVLYGTILIGKDLMALLSPADAPSGSSRPVRAGEAFDGWTVVEIQSKTVTVKWDQTTETLIMNDPTAQVARIYGKTGDSSSAASPRVTTVAPISIPVTATPVPTGSPFAPQTQTISPTGKKQIVIHTPFGDKVMDDPSQ